MTQTVAIQARKRTGKIDQFSVDATLSPIYNTTMTTEEKVQSPKLSPKQIKHLRGLGHKLSALVLVGKEGISSGIIEAAQTELTNHELIKVKIGNNSNVDKKEAANHIPAATNSSLVQLIGKTLLLYKANPELPKEKRVFLPKK